MRDTQPPRRRLQRLRHDLGVVDPARPARTFRVLEPLKTIGLIAGPTRDHRLSGTPTRCAISLFVSPCEANNTIRARCAIPARPAVDRDHERSTASSPSRNTSAGAGG